MPYQYSLEYLPGKDMVCADVLSRAPVPDVASSPAESRSMEEYVSMVLKECPVRPADIQ